MFSSSLIMFICNFFHLFANPRWTELNQTSIDSKVFSRCYIKISLFPLNTLFKTLLRQTNIVNIITISGQWGYAGRLPKLSPVIQCVNCITQSIANRITFQWKLNFMQNKKYSRCCVDIFTNVHERDFRLFIRVITSIKIEI